jgi:hypothetical protein
MFMKKKNIFILHVYKKDREAEFLDIIGTKNLRVFLLAIHNKSGLKLV